MACGDRGRRSGGAAPRLRLGARRRHGGGRGGGAPGACRDRRARARGLPSSGRPAAMLVPAAPARARARVLPGARARPGPFDRRRRDGGAWHAGGGARRRLRRDSEYDRPVSAMGETIASQPGELRRLLLDDSAVGPAAERLRGRRVLLVGTGTSWHAASIGAWFLRVAGVDAWAVQAMDAALGGPRPTADDGLILLSHRGTKLYTTDVVERARADGAAVVSISAKGVPGADIETVEPERSSAFTASHLGALMRLAQVAVALGAELDLAAV